MPASTIDEVVHRLTDIIAESIRTGSRLGYFAALYNRVTMRVRQGVARGEFEDNRRMEQLDVYFANRYLDAYDQHRRGELPSRSWAVAFAAAERADHTVLQHLMLGMNAHIGLDLGVAAARVSPGRALSALKQDFYKINDVLYSLVALVEEQNETIAPMLGQMVRFTDGAERTVADFFMGQARDMAWLFATELAPLSPAAQLPVIGRQDLMISATADVLLQQAVLEKLLGHGESQDVVGNIQILAAGELSSAP
jgi:hypothetical protein